MSPLREIYLLADSGIRWFFAYSLVMVLNVDVIMVYFFLKYPRLLLIKENKRKNCPLMKLNRLNMAFQDFHNTAIYLKVIVFGLWFADNYAHARDTTMAAVWPLTSRENHLLHCIPIAWRKSFHVMICARSLARNSELTNQNRSTRCIATPKGNPINLRSDSNGVRQL